MPRIGVMTFLHNDNYGSTLQAWALQTALQAMGMDAEHIDYRPDSREKLLNLLRSGNSPRLILDGLRKRAVKAEQAGARSKAEAFPTFYQQHMRLSAPCRNHAALRKAAEQYDLLMCGSDQIWSPVWLNPAFFLDFAEKQPKVAYAASLGVSREPKPAKMRKMERLIAPFKAISVREQEGAELVQRMTDRSTVVMPDPVCLIERSQWLALAEQPKEQEPYIVCYFIGNQPQYWQRAKQLSEQLGCKVVVIPVTDEAYHQPWQLADGLSPQAWLGWLAGAERVLTDSFHGAMFSCILGRPLTIMRRYREDDPESKNSRIDQLMRMLHLQTNDETMDWPTIDAAIVAERERGLAWLKQAIETAMK